MREMISRHKVAQMTNLLKEAILYLDSQSPDVKMALTRLQEIQNFLEDKLRCPKCNSSDVLVGSQTEPNRCAKCKHSWHIENVKGVVLGSESTYRKVFVKQPEVLATINTNFIKRINKSLSSI